MRSPQQRTFTGSGIVCCCCCCCRSIWRGSANDTVSVRFFILCARPALLKLFAVKILNNGTANVRRGISSVVALCHTTGKPVQGPGGCQWKTLGRAEGAPLGICM